MTGHDCGPNARKLFDARNIYCCRVCDVCEPEKRTQFRPEIFTDPAYECDEPIDEEG